MSEPTWPNIGPDPLKNRDYTLFTAIERLQKGVDLQQPEVPDQSMLAWRIDVARLLCEVTWRNAAMKNLPPTPPSICVWKYDEHHCAWDTGCDNKHQFMNDGPSENSCKFCTYCGGELKVIQPETTENV